MSIMKFINKFQRKSISWSLHHCIWYNILRLSHITKCKIRKKCVLQNYKMNFLNWFSWSLIYGQLSILILSSSSCMHCQIKPNRSKRYKKFWIRVNCIKVEVTKNRNIFMSPENLLLFLSPYPYTTFVTLRPKNYVKK